MDYSHLCIELGQSPNDTLTLKYELRDNPVTKIWVERMLVKDAYPLDHPDRFYGFNSLEEENFRAVNSIQRCIDTINSYQPIIIRPFTSIHDQDTLNYLHNIFERYHGLLDQQNTEFWNHAPVEVQKALAELNIAVHRCEAVNVHNRPRFVCTWFGLPKTVAIPVELMAEYGELMSVFGSIVINYAEIGKTFVDFASDNDRYISDEAFKPFEHVSADFVAYFFERSVDTFDRQLALQKEYFEEHKDFFQSRGYKTFDHPKILPFKFRVAQLIETMPRTELIKEIQKHQYVNKVWLE